MSFTPCLTVMMSMGSKDERKANATSLAMLQNQHFEKQKSLTSFIIMRAWPALYFSQPFNHSTGPKALTVPEDLTWSTHASMSRAASRYSGASTCASPISSLGNPPSTKSAFPRNEPIIECEGWRHMSACSILVA